jgi:hypothetical protein
VNTLFGFHKRFGKILNFLFAHIDNPISVSLSSLGAHARQLGKLRNQS